jgi:hypothetical protein
VVAKGQPFSVRLQEDTERFVEAEARRTRRTTSAVVEASTDENARTKRFAEAVLENKRPIADVDVLFPFLTVADA